MQTVVFENQEYIWVPSIGRFVCLNIPEGDIPAVRAYHDSLTLAELHLLVAFLDQNHLDIINERGEWTADFVDYGEERGHEHELLVATFVSRPTTVVKDDGRWSYTGGTTTEVELPPSGWVVRGPMGQLYHPLTGTPYRTTPEPDSSAEASNYAYFWRSEPGSGLRAVSRECERMSQRAFDFAAVYEPDFTHDNCGFRPTRLPKDGS